MANKPGLWGGGGVGRQEEGEGSIPAKQQGQAQETPLRCYAKKGRRCREQHGCERHLTFWPAGGSWVS